MSARERDKSFKWPDVAIRGMAIAISVCLILLTVVTAMSANSHLGRSENANQVESSDSEPSVSSEKPAAVDSEKGNPGVASDDTEVAEDPKEDVIYDESLDEAAERSETVISGFERRPTVVSHVDETGFNHSHAIGPPVAEIDDIRIFADPDSDRLYLRGVIKSRAVGLIDNQVDLDSNSGSDNGMPTWDLTVVATGRSIGSNGSDSWSTTLNAQVGEVRLGVRQEFALRSSQLQIKPQDFIDIQLEVSVNGSTATSVNALAIAWEAQDRPPMPPGELWWDLDGSEFVELS